MRHTAATLMLASGENPEWIAAMLGHSTTEMLFRVYSRFVPNLTRNDGRAYTGLLNATKAKSDSASQVNFSTASIAELSLAQKAQLLAELTRQIHIN
jgi:integrase